MTPLHVQPVIMAGGSGTRLWPLSRAQHPKQFLVLHGSRNGYYFTLDRLTGEHLVTSKYSDTVNWAKGIDKKGDDFASEVAKLTMGS